MSTTEALPPRLDASDGAASIQQKMSEISAQRHQL